MRSQGRRVDPNPLEGLQGAGRQGDRFVDGFGTEFKILDSAKAESIANSVAKSIKRGGQARVIVFDGRGANLTRLEAERAINLLRQSARARTKLLAVEIIGNNFFIRTSLR